MTKKKLNLKLQRIYSNFSPLNLTWCHITTLIIYNTIVQNYLLITSGEYPQIVGLQPCSWMDSEDGHVGWRRKFDFSTQNTVVMTRIIRLRIFIQSQSVTNFLRIASSYTLAKIFAHISTSHSNHSNRKVRWCMNLWRKRGCVQNFKSHVYQFLLGNNNLCGLFDNMKYIK